MPAVVVPDALRRRYGRTRQGRAWLDGLPALVRQSLSEFGLQPEAGAAPWHGHGALVLPVVAEAGPAVLKLPYPHPEAATETAALELWDGAGAVRLLGRNPSGSALLLERLDSRSTLETVPVQEAADIWGQLVRRLSLSGSAAPQWAAIPSVAEEAERFSDELPADWEALGRPFERWLLEAALEVCQTRGTVGRRSTRDVLVHADLHYGNILRRLDGSGEYAAIDPQAVFGEAEYAVAPMLWNRLADLDSRSPQRSLRSRVTDLCAAAGLDPQAAREWSILREVVNALDYYRDGQTGDAHRSVWVAAALTGRTHPGLPSAGDLPAA